MSRKGTLLGQVFRIFSTNLGTKLVSIVIAVVLWGVVLGSRNVEVTKEIPVEIITSPDIIASNEIPEKVSFRLSGPKAFLRTILDRREDPIRINLSGAKPSLLTYRFFSDSIRVPIGVKVLAINPGAIQIKLEYLKRKDVPVRVELRGTPPDGYRIAAVQMKPEIIHVKGPEGRVDGLTEVATTPIDVSDLKRTIEKEVSLDLLRSGIQLDGPVPRVFIQVEPVSANFRIKNVDIRVVSSYKVRIEERSVTVLVRATSKDLESLNRNQIFAVIDLSGKGKGRFFEPIKVTLPASISLVKVIPDHAAVTLY